MRFLLKALVTGDSENSLERIAGRLDNIETAHMASDEVCADVFDRLMPSSLIGFLAEVALGSYVDLPETEERGELKEALDLCKAPQPTTIAAKRTQKEGSREPAKKMAKPKA